MMIKPDIIRYYKEMCKNSATHICKEEDCKNCFERSMASHPKAAYWSKKNTVPPRHVGQKSIHPRIYDCDKCGHDFAASPANVTTKGSWCPYCAHHKLCDNEGCKQCYEASCASRECAKTWSDKNILTARQVIFGTSTRYIFDCEVCEHDYTSVPSTKHGCPYCAHLKLCPDEDCVFCYSNSLASHECAAFLREGNPRMIFKSSHKKVKFGCIANHIFNMAPNTVTIKKSWCPSCMNKTQGKLHNWLRERYPDVIEQATFDWCKSESNRRLRYDYYIPSLNTIIELDGRQHIEQVSNWNCERVWILDKHKNASAVINGKRVIRILQAEVLNSTGWEDELEEQMQRNFEPELVYMYDPITGLTDKIVNITFG